MQTKITYTIIFVMAFVFTTAVLMVLNNNFENIFQFNFSKPRPPVIRTGITRLSGTKIDYAQIKSYIRNEFKKEILDSVKLLKKDDKKDTMFTALIKDIDSLKSVNRKLEKTEIDLATREKELQNLRNLEKAKEDSAYTKWKKEMVRIYDAMDSKAAARIIQNLPEKSAKDILSAMKSKKVAKILSEVSPEIASRLMRKE